MLRDASERLQEVEAELLATRQELAACRHQNPSPSLATCPEELREELLRLRSLLERRLADSKQPNTSDAASGEVATPSNPEADTHAITPLAVFLGSLGFVLGWYTGSRYTRRAEQRRRWRLRF